ncbi:MAG: T9SS type A sorting domain-containing protein, partial [Bacteroidota bacterium]
YTSSYSSIEFNVLENDKFGLNSSCFSVVSQPQFGSITEASWPKGTITYQPSPGFSGVYKFTYRINSPLCDEDFETATVYVFVSNFEPAGSKFLMSTPKLTPLVIGYNVPIQDFRFQIVDQGELGQVEFFEGQQDVSIYGKEVSGFNLIVYTPDLGVVSGTDEFEIKYCVLDDNNCVYEQSVKVEVEILDIGDGINPSCFGDCIWPGDTNFDGVVNMEDLMPLGLKMGKIGVPRSEINLTQWYGQFGDNWENEIENMELNIKHLDTDGDSIIMGTDTSAISDFYGLTHSLYSNGVPFNQYAIELTGTIFASPGDLIELDMKLGNDNQPAVDVYGFVFPFNYNPDFFVGESVDISFDDNSWLTYNSPVLYMTKNHSNGLSEAGFTRTSGNAASGKGIIGKVQLIIQDDIIGIRTDEDELAINIGGGVATAMNGQGQQFGIEMGGATIHIVLDKEEEQLNKELRDDQLIVYPNPTPNMLNVHLNGGQDFERVVLFTLTGQQVFDSGNIQTNHLELNTQQLTNGIYLLSVHAPNGVINRKVEVLR